MAAWAWRWLASATSSCSVRPTFHSFTISSQCWPIDRPVEGSTTPGASGRKWPGRNRARVPSRAPKLLAVDRSTKMRLARRPNSTGGLDIDSTPPAMPLSARPPTIASRTAVMADSPVMQLLEIVRARVRSSSGPRRTTSRARWGMRGSPTTMPQTSSSIAPGSTAVRFSRPSMARQARSRADCSRNTVPALTKGVRAPSTMATRVAWCAVIRSSPDYRPSLSMIASVSARVSVAPREIASGPPGILSMS